MRLRQLAFPFVALMAVFNFNPVSAQTIIGKKITYSMRNIPKVIHFLSPEAVLQYDSNSDCVAPGGGRFGAIAKLNGTKVSNVKCTFKSNGGKAAFKVTATGRYVGNTFSMTQRWIGQGLRSDTTIKVKINGSRCSGTHQVVTRFKNRTTRDNQKLKNCKIR